MKCKDCGHKIEPGTYHKWRKLDQDGCIIKDLKPLDEYFSFPLAECPYGIYIHDSVNHVVANTFRNDGDKMIEILVKAFNKVHGYENMDLPVLTDVEKFELPIRYYEEKNCINDDNGEHIMIIRGWGRLQYLDGGPNEAIEVQKMIGNALADAVNEAYGV